MMITDVMTNITDYKIVYAEDSGDFQVDVWFHMDNGWELYGTPFHTSYRFCQAMVKKEKEKDNG